MARNKEITARKAARRLGLRLDSLYALLWAGKLPGRKKEGRWVIPTAAVEARLQRKKGHAR